MPSSAIDERSFHRILRRNVMTPLLLGIFAAALFAALITYLLDQINWVEHTDRVINNAHETQKLIGDMESGVRGFLLSGDERYLDIYEVAKTRVPAGIKSLQHLVSDNGTQEDRIGRIAELQSAWAERAKNIVELRRNNGDVQSVMSQGKGKRLGDEMRSEFSALISMEQSLRVERTEAVQRTTITTVAVFILFTLVTNVALALLGRRELTGLSNAYTKILNAQNQSTARLEHDAWLKAGQSSVAQRMLGELSIESVARSTLGFFSEFLGSVVAAFYARQSDGSLARVASYGFSREQEARTPHFASAEGLVGEAAANNTIMTLNALPDGYLKVSSGLGEGSPASVLIAPVTNDDGVNGIVELGFLRALTPRDSELLTTIGHDIGIAIEAARYRQRIQDMLQETQGLNEELQVQQEELRTSNEELEEQSQVLKASQAHLEIQQVDLEQANKQLMDQSSELSRQRDTLDQNNRELKVAQEELKAQALALERSSRYKSEFLANMSHELRTPLNSALILSKLLADNPHANLTDEQVKFAESIYSAGNDLLKLINDILDIAKVEAGRFEIFPEHFTVDQLLEGLKNTFEPLASDKQLSLTIDSPSEGLSALYTDRLRLAQVLKNLLGNAIKFTEAGSVRLSVSQTPEGKTVFAVIDSGIGIAPDQIESIFEAFQQGDGSINRRYGGTGLGLSISTRLTHLLGGRIAVDSTPGSGSTFTLEIPSSIDEATTVLPASAPVRPSPPTVASPIDAPVSAPAAAPASLDPPPSPAPRFDDDRNDLSSRARTILIIEDDQAFARVLFDLAHERGYGCLIAHSADEGIELAERMTPDAILLDMHLPDYSGLTVLQRLKEMSSTRHIPVHVVSVEDRQHTAMQLGAVGFAVKPTSLTELKEVFAKLEEKVSQRMKRVLLVEDDARQRESVVRLISDDDIEIIAVERGQEALDLLRETLFDCMIIDLKLPDMTGNELLEQMARANVSAFPPVIVYTGRNLTRSEESSLLKYSRTIIIKGARSPERLLDEVTLFLHKVEKDLSTDRQTMLKAVRNRDRIFEGRTIMVVDDDIRNIFALTSALEQKGALIQVARDGVEALEKLRAAPEVDLVLMDIMMPRMDGYEATRHIRQNPAWRTLPIIAVTAKAMKNDQERCLAAGANDYLAKPIDLDRLSSLLRIWMPKIEVG